MATRRPSDDDSSEEEATAIDLRSSSQALKPPSRASAPSAPSAPSVPGAAPRKVPPVTSSRPMHSSEDEEATEFLAVRPSSSGIASEAASSPSSLRARGRAVPLEPGAETSTPSAAAEKRASKEEELLADLPTGPTPMPAALPTRTPRPLPGERQTNVKSETQTGSSQKSAPRITRIFQADGAHERIGGADPASTTDPGEDEVTDPPATRPPRPRPLPERADSLGAGVPPRPAPRPATIVVHGPPDERRTDERESEEAPHRPSTTKTSQPTSETLEAEPADGTLIVEVPDGAVVFINGIERGKGPALKVNGIDRYAKHAVRIHAPGHAPWSGSVCLEGRTAAKIRPSLRAKR